MYAYGRTHTVKRLERLWAIFVDFGDRIAICSLLIILIITRRETPHTNSWMKYHDALFVLQCTTPMLLLNIKITALLHLPNLEDPGLIVCVRPYAYRTKVCPISGYSLLEVVLHNVTNFSDKKQLEMIWPPPKLVPIQLDQM